MNYRLVALSRGVRSKIHQIHFIKKKKKKKEKRSCHIICAPGAPQVSLGWLDATLVEACIGVYAHRMSQVGQGVVYEEIGGLKRVRRGSTE
jgi:hypothetical protein